MRSYTEAETGRNVSELLKEALPEGASYDVAMPQEWVNEMARRGIDTVGHFVWLYDLPDLSFHSIFGQPYPITTYGRVNACRVRMS